MRFSNKYLTASLSLAALALASTEASAQTAQVIGQTNNIGSLTEVLTKGTKYGAMGAEFDARDDISSASGGAMTQRISAGAWTWLFGKKYPLVTFDVTGNGSSTSSSASISTSLLGQTASTKNYGSLSASVGFCTTEKSPSQQMMIGPIPVVMELGAGLCPGLTLTGSVKTDTSGTTLKITGTPDINVGATAYIGIGTKVASAGVKGSLTLLDVAVPIQNTMVFSGSSLTDYTTGNVDISFLNGEFDLYAKAGWGWFSVEYDWTLLSWPGFHWSFAGFSDQKPVAKSLALTIKTVSGTGGVADASYSFSGLTESNSPWTYERASDANGTGATQIASGTTSSASARYAITQFDSYQFLRFCVTPKNVSSTGAKTCTAWNGVGPVHSIREDQNYTGRVVHFPYKHSASGTCFNLPDYNFNDLLTSYHFRYDASMTKASLAFYRDANCAGAMRVDSVSDNASDGAVDVPLIESAWNDQISSFRIVWNDDVSATDVAVGFSTSTNATPSYTYFDSTNMAESGTKYQWQRADDSAGTNAQVVKAYSTNGNYALGAADEEKYLRLCVKASNGVLVGDESCSGFTYTGKFLTLYSDQNFSGTTLRYPYQRWPAGTCVNLRDASFNDALTSYTVSSSPYTSVPGDYIGSGVIFFWDVDCAGATTGTGFPTGGGTASVANIGSTWNDQASSFLVLYRYLEAREPMVTFSGASAQPAYAFMNSTGAPESGTKYQWQRADDSAGTNAQVVQAYGTTAAYAITPNDNAKFLRVCIKPSDGVSVGNASCSDWGSVGLLVTMYDQTMFTGNQRSLAYEHMNGQCLSLSDLGMSAGVLSAMWSSYQYTQPAGDATAYGFTLYTSDDCTTADATPASLFWMDPSTGGTDNKASIGNGSTLRSIRVNYPHVNGAW